MPEAMLKKPAAEMHPHEEHGVTKVWEGREIDAVDDARRATNKAKTASEPSDEMASKANKTRKR